MYDYRIRRFSNVTTMGKSGIFDPHIGYSLLICDYAVKSPQIEVVLKKGYFFKKKY